jgi:hypothetical protein
LRTGAITAETPDRFSGTRAGQDESLTGPEMRSVPLFDLRPGGVEYGVPGTPCRGNSRQGCRWCRVARADGDSQVSALGVDLPSGAPFACKHRLKHRNRAPGQQGLRAGANLLGRNLDGNQIARKYRTCAGHADLLFRDGGKRQAGKCDCLLEFTSRPELSLRAARESGHNSMCQNGLKVLLRVTVRTKKRDSSAISSGVAALKSAESTPVRDCPGLLAR